MSGHDVPSPGTPPTGGDPGYDAVLEDLLAGRLGHAPEDEMGLVGLVDALRAPGSDEELGDVDAATSAFVSARAAASAGSAAVIPLASRRTGRAAVAVAAVLGGVVLLGGTAAAATGNLPPTLQDAVHVILPFVPTAQEAEAAKKAELTSTSARPGSSDATEPGAPGSSTRSPSKGAGQSLLPLATDDPSRFGQCRAYFNRSDAAAGSTAYARLTLAAARASTTPDEWCRAFAPGTEPTRKPTTTPGGNGNNSGGNGNGSTKKPTAPPTGPGNNNSGGNGNGGGPAVTPSKKPTAAPRPTSPGKPSSPGSQGNGKPSSTP